MLLSYTLEPQHPFCPDISWPISIIIYPWQFKSLTNMQRNKAKMKTWKERKTCLYVPKVSCLPLIKNCFWMSAITVPKLSAHN